MGTFWLRIKTIILTHQPRNYLNSTAETLEQVVTSIES